MTTWTTEDRLHAGETPLTDEQILQFRDMVPYTLASDLLKFARAIEKAHGITE